MPTFANILDLALEIAKGEQAFEVCPLIAYDGRKLLDAWRKSTPDQRRAYRSIVQQAYYTLRGRELLHERIASKR